MRLTAIKLAGFKSFVEPATIKLPSNLMAVVGPNGCGKSNIIDAVRWVMGESSARQLRGESMSDVIFSGSSARKPVGTASVELMFDNSDGRAGGEYANYNEISVRRQVSRDGQSAYFLNGSRCRRKDITDLFLGTGLGPRSYAIIEQGMISQIVEARPEELRAFLEEAAGISVYKERRRETENRIRHTRENLERLSDLREEVAKQLEKLKRQARAAERYRKLKQRYRDEEARLSALRWRRARGELEQHAARLRETETRIEQAVAEQREAEKALETLRERQHQASEKTSSIQAELYEVAGEIARLEQSIEHQKDLLERQRNEYTEVESQINELQQHLVLDRAQVEDVTGRIAELEPALEKARSAEHAAREAFEQAEAALAERQEQWQKCRSEASATRQRVELLKLRIEHLDERMSQASQRLEKLAADDGGAREKLDAERAQTRRDLEAAETELERARAALGEKREAVSGAREAIERLRGELDELRGREREIRGRVESLHVLNRPRAEDDSQRAWLAERGLDTGPSLLESLHVDPDWQNAAETVLERWLAARMIDGDVPHEPPVPGLGLIAEQAETDAPRPGTLAEKLSGAGALTVMLNAVHCCADADEAFSRVASMGPAESVITPDGLWLGRGWSWRANSGDDESEGRLARQREIRTLEGELDALTREIETRMEDLAERERRHGDGSAAMESGRDEVERLQARVSELSGIRAGQDNRREALERRRAEMEQEHASLIERQQGDREALAAARREMQEALEELERLDGRENELLATRNEQQKQREKSRHDYRGAREAREEIALKVESCRASLDSLKQAIRRMDTQVGQLQGRYVELSEKLAQGDRPVRAQQTERDGLLTRRLEVEERLKASRAELEELEQQWRELDRRRRDAAAGADAIREQQSAAQVHRRELEIEVERHAGRVAELDGDLDALAAELPEDAETQAWVDELGRLEEKIRRLEPVNLAAIQEREQEAERKDYLDRQHADLTEALETLEQAIARIDRTTRTRFRDTFERINANLETLFPRLFGGGHAHLEMVGDDWLTAGAAILARPPGKRITRIHLLSGGEKALTAVAFVFAIFNLNPAPFCLLDEVDAPLDDANVGRFSELVQEMSDKVQFLFVTHNKVTMEVAHQMLGVTMREPGISRLVSVDLEKAVAMAAS
ncbi:MAG: chromosome segregation protein SMC [Wenzhouxiangellaceae bacterium]|nr:chromosome segregation protein SMC [Wenzhouxiangellaceae bacterium]